MRILLAEDEKRMAAALVALLKQEKYDVDHLEDGASALVALESGVYDMLLMNSSTTKTSPKSRMSLSFFL